MQNRRIEESRLGQIDNDGPGADCADHFAKLLLHQWSGVEVVLAGERDDGDAFA